jgi:hypothetical protein
MTWGEFMQRIDSDLLKLPYRYCLGTLCAIIEVLRSLYDTEVHDAHLVLMDESGKVLHQASQVGIDEEIYSQARNLCAPWAAIMDEETEETEDYVNGVINIFWSYYILMRELGGLSPRYELMKTGFYIHAILDYSDLSVGIPVAHPNIDHEVDESQFHIRVVSACRDVIETAEIMASEGNPPNIEYLREKFRSTVKPISRDFGMPTSAWDNASS